VSGAVPVDQDARDAIRDDLRTTILVEAAAGTGKTTSLVSRMVNLVRQGEAPASSIAAITFTVKAAAQLRERFQESLEEALGSAAGDEAERLRIGLQQIHHGFTGTTHAFCARLLRERPVEAGLDPEFEELDEAVALQLALDFWNRWYEEEGRRANPLLREAWEARINFEALRGAFLRLVEYPDVEMWSERVERPPLEAVVEQLLDFLGRCEPNMPTEAHREKADGFELLMRQLFRKRDSIDPADIAAQFELLDDANHASRKPTKRNWPDGTIAKNLGLEYKDFVDLTLRPLLARWAEYAHGIALEILRPAAAAFAAERRLKGTLTFQDLLLCTRDMLRDHPRVRSYFQRRFTHLLVDEFQDTDPLQAEVLFYLTGSDTEERKWRELTPRPGSLFIVGDPKQSIYRFRRADITTYLDVRKRIEATGGRILQLSTNFRSSAPICAFVNETFSNLFDAGSVDAGRQAAHVPLAAHREGLLSDGVFLLELQDAKVDEMAEEEARRVAEWIHGVVTRGEVIEDESGQRLLRWSDVLLVSWGRARLGHYAAALESAGIPYEVTGSYAFKDSEELSRVLPILHAVIDPDDSISVAAFLRGPLCGVDDEALYRYVQEGGRFQPFADVREGTDLRIVNGLGVIREGIEESRTHPPAAAISRLFDRLGIIPFAASGQRPGTASGSIYLWLALAREASARGESLPAIVAQLEALVGARADNEELDINPSTSNAVRLMNLHQVKGLEAAVVFLIDPADDRDHPVELVVARGDVPRGHLLITRRWGQQKKEVGRPRGWSDLAQREKQFVNSEKQRLLYVAATRARSMLAIGFRQSATKGVRGAWRDLVARARGPLQFDVPGVAVSVQTEAMVHSFEEARAAIAGRFRESSESSYSVLPITKIAHGSHAELVRAEEGLGKGMSWGRVLHRLFEAMLRDESLDIRLYAGNLLKDEERDAAKLSEVLRVVEAVRVSPLWTRVLKADERLVEVPFALTVPARDVGVDADGETLLHGAIDLVFREGDLWTIVDYKTDSTAKRLEALVDYYKSQVEHYARFWSQLTGAKTAAGLFFVDGCVERWIVAG
jgi:ATP-dependent helicase/nuclease subunit A